MNRGAAILLRWMLLSVLAWGVVAMHHVDTAAVDHAGHHSGGHAVMSTVSMHHGGAAATDLPAGTDEEPVPGGIHAFLHLCLAVIAAAASLVVLVCLFRRLSDWPSPGVSSASGIVRPAARPPPPVWGRDILHRVCVLRL